jgi:hypothetical protein
MPKIASMHLRASHGCGARLTGSFMVWRPSTATSADAESQRPCADRRSNDRPAGPGLAFWRPACGFVAPSTATSEIVGAGNRTLLAGRRLFGVFLHPTTLVTVDDFLLGPYEIGARYQLCGTMRSLRRKLNRRLL